MQKAECSKCGGVRNCDIRGEHKESYSDENFWGQAILECRGCDNVFVETVATNSEDYSQKYAPDGSGETIVTMEETIKYWPALSKRERPERLKKNALRHRK